MLDGTVLGRCMAQHTHKEFIKFLNAVEHAVPVGKIIHAIAVVHQAFMFQCGQVGLLLEQMSPDELMPLTPPQKLTELLKEGNA